MRNLTDDAAQKVIAARNSLAEFGVPNFYDDQRFGSLGESGEFIGRPWCLGDYERALWLAIAEPNSHDRPNDRDEKEIIRRLWGDWVACKATLRKSSSRSIITYLVDHPERFRDAFALLRQDLRSLWLAAYQSDLWNRCLAARLGQSIPASRTFPVQLATSRVSFFTELTESETTELQGLALPLPSARLHLDPGPLLDLYETILAEQGLALRELRVKYPRDSFFSKGERTAIVRPTEFKIGRQDADELNEGRHRLTLEFVLPRGSYATIVIKRLTLIP